MYIYIHSEWGFQSNLERGGTIFQKTLCQLQGLQHSHDGSGRCWYINANKTGIYEW